jgi:YD repeat-containing protein
MTVTGTENYTTAYTYDKNNRLLTETKTVDSVDEVTTYTYDANGNTLTATTGNDVITYTYNCRDQQAGATEPIR